MKCPKCECLDQKVPNTNTYEPEMNIRRRTCKACGHKFYTIEMIIDDESVTWRRMTTGTGESKKSVPVLRHSVMMGVKVAKDR